MACALCSFAYPLGSGMIVAVESRRITNRQLVRALDQWARRFA